MRDRSGRTSLCSRSLYRKDNTSLSPLPPWPGAHSRTRGKNPLLGGPHFHFYEEFSPRFFHANLQPCKRSRSHFLDRHVKLGMNLTHENCQLSPPTCHDLPETSVPIFSNSHMLLRGTRSGPTTGKETRGEGGVLLEEDG